MGFNRFLGGTSSFLFRLITYTLLQWIPGRQGNALPFLFVLYLLSWIANNSSLNRQRAKERSKLTDSHIVNEPIEDASVPPLITEQANAPSYAAVAAHAPASPSRSVNGSVSSKSTARRRNLRRIASSNGSLSSSADGGEAAVRRKSKKAKREARSRLWTFLVGAPGSSKLLNCFALLANLALLAAAMDFIFTPIVGMEQNDLAFIRVGAISHSTAKLSARIPPPIQDTSAVNGADEVELPPAPSDEARLVYRPTKPLGKWLPGPPFLVSAERDWTAVVQITRLWAATEYEYRVISEDGSHHPAFPNKGKFITAPDPALASGGSVGAGTHFTFAATSCVKANFPYRPFQHSFVAGAKHLSKAIDDFSVNFLLFLGDFIYADTPFYGGADVGSYHKRYRQIMASPEMKEVVEKIPMMAIWDDHEIVNDYDKNATDEAFAPAQTAYLDFIGAANPEPYRKGVNYYDFVHGDSAFFVWDTRQYRSPNDAEDDESKTMLGKQQLADFNRWVHRVNQTVTWKFVVSSVPFNSLWSHADDTWAGFLTERDAIMDVLETVDNVIVLSGDRHEFAATSTRTKVTEFSTSPLNQFYLPIRTLHQKHGRGAIREDVLLKYIPDGNSKFSTFEVDTRVANKPTVKVKVHIDGEVAWEVEIHGKPLAPLPPVQGIGALGKSLLELLGFKKRSWF